MGSSFSLSFFLTFVFSRYKKRKTSLANFSNRTRQERAGLEIATKDGEKSLQAWFGLGSAQPQRQ